MLLDALRLVEQVRAADVRFQPAYQAEVPAAWADISLARRRPGCEPRTSLADGVRALVDWYRRERAWASQRALE